MPKIITYPTFWEEIEMWFYQPFIQKSIFLYKSSQVSYTVCMCSAVQLMFIMWSRCLQYSSAQCYWCYIWQFSVNCCFLIWFYCFSYDTEVVEKPFSVILIILYIDYYFESFEQTFPQKSIFIFFMFRAIISVSNEKEV